MRAKSKLEVRIRSEARVTVAKLAFIANYV